MDKLEINKWYKYIKSGKDELVVYPTTSKYFGYGRDTDGKWCKNTQWSMLSRPEDWRLATHDEIESALTTEALKRGYADGVVVKSFIHDKEMIIKEQSRHTSYIPDFNKLHFGYETDIGWVVIFKDGEWAPIIGESKITDSVVDLSKAEEKENREIMEELQLIFN